METVHHSNPSTGTRSLPEGWHAFRIRTADFNTTGGAWQGRPALSFTSPVSAGALPFDERNLRIVAHPYGFIGGELALGEGSVLTNTADTPCRVVGRVVGTGTLSGPFTLDGAVLEAACTARDREAGCISFDHPEAKALEKVGKIRAAFDSVPLLLTYSLGIPALGLETLDPEALQDRLECVISGQEVAGRMRLLVDEGGSLILRNLKPQGTQIIVR